MISDPARDGPDGAAVAADPPEASGELSPPPDPPEVSIRQPASASVAVTRTVAADRAETEASTRRGSMRVPFWAAGRGGR
jgi:hypothetical protein